MSLNYPLTNLRPGVPGKEYPTDEIARRLNIRAPLPPLPYDQKIKTLLDRRQIVARGEERDPRLPGRVIHRNEIRNDELPYNISIGNKDIYLPDNSQVVRQYQLNEYRFLINSDDRDTAVSVSPFIFPVKLQKSQLSTGALIPMELKNVEYISLDRIILTDDYGLDPIISVSVREIDTNTTGTTTRANDHCNFFLTKVRTEGTDHFFSPLGRYKVMRFHKSRDVRQLTFEIKKPDGTDFVPTPGPNFDNTVYILITIGVKDKYLAQFPTE